MREMKTQKIPLVFVPGLLSNETVWKHQISGLKDIASITVVTLTDEDTPEKMVNKILSAAPAKFALCGHSMGGWLALEVMREAPERVLKLCLINTTARIDSTEKLARRKEMIQAVQDGKFFDIARQIADHFVFKKSVYESVLEMFLKVGKDSFIHQQHAMMQRNDCIPILPNIHVPTLVIHAQQDQNFSEECLKELAALIPKAQLDYVKDSGHMSPMEAPEEITALLRPWTVN